MGKEYRWYFELDCSESTKQLDNDSTSYATITGTVCLIDPPQTFDRELSSAKNTLERAKIFAKYGIWHDTVAELIQLHSQQPNNSDYKQIWQNLLRQPEIGQDLVSDLSFVGKATVLTVDR